MHPFIVASIVIFAVVLPIAAFIGFQIERKKENPDKFQGVFLGALIGLIPACVIVAFLGLTCAFCF